MAIRDTPAGRSTADADRAKHGRRLTKEMDEVVSLLAYQGATPATILQALDQGYADGRFPFVPARETVSRLVSKKLARYGLIAMRAGPAWEMLGPLPVRRRRGTGRHPGRDPAEDDGTDADDAAVTVQDRVALSALPAAVTRGRWPDRETVRWWAYLAARAPDLPADDLPDLVALWRARLAEGKPVRDLVLFVACAPWRGVAAFDRYLRTVVAAGEPVYPQWQGFLPTVAAWLAGVVDDLRAIVRVLVTGGPVLGPSDRAIDEKEWRFYAGTRWAAARESLVTVLPVVWQGVVSAAPPGPTGTAGRVPPAGPDEPPGENWFWRQVRRSDVLLAPPWAADQAGRPARSVVGQAWRWRSAAVSAWTVLGPYQPVRMVLLAVLFDLARAVVAVDHWAAAGFPTFPAPALASVDAEEAEEPGERPRPPSEAATVDLAGLRHHLAGLCAQLEGLASVAGSGFDDRQVLTVLDPTGSTWRAASLVAPGPASDGAGAGAGDAPGHAGGTPGAGGAP